MVRITLPIAGRLYKLYRSQAHAWERTASEAPPRVCLGFVTQEAGASAALRSQAEPGNEFL